MYVCIPDQTAFAGNSAQLLHYNMYTFSQNFSINTIKSSVKTKVLPRRELCQFNIGKLLLNNMHQT